MNELLRSNDMVLISYVESVLRDAGIDHRVLDAHMSVLEGTLGILPRRVMVSSEHTDRAKKILDDLGLSHERS